VDGLQQLADDYGHANAGRRIRDAEKMMLVRTWRPQNASPSVEPEQPDFPLIGSFRAWPSLASLSESALSSDARSGYAKVQAEGIFATGGIEQKVRLALKPGYCQHDQRR